MKFLFFDLECASCSGGIGKVCEFGYVLTDDRFKETDRNIFLIDPKTAFERYVVKNILTYPVYKYRSRGDYRRYFKRISPLFADPETLIVGHSVDLDMKYLNDEARRYGLPFFGCKFYDAKYMYKMYEGNPKEVRGVKGICEALGIAEPEHKHRSVDDAYSTMLIVKELCARMDVSLTELIASCEECRGETKNGKIILAAGKRVHEKKKSPKPNKKPEKS